MKIKQILFAILVLVFPCISVANDYYIATSDLNVRSGAGTTHNVAFTLLKGDQVEVLSKNGNWYEIKFDNESGYAHSKYLKSISDTEFNTSQQSDSEDSSLGIILIIIGSGRTTFGEKIAWILAVLFISWFAWIFYMLLAPIKK